MKNIEGRIRQLGRRERYTLTLVIVVVVFVVCELPDLLLRPSRLSQVKLQVANPFRVQLKDDDSAERQQQTNLQTTLPDLFLRSWMLLHRISPGQVYYPLDSLRAINTISNLFLTVNSSVNFIIYCLVGRRFRDVMIRVICSAEFRHTSLLQRRRSRQRWTGHGDLSCGPVTMTSVVSVGPVAVTCVMWTGHGDVCSVDRS